MSDMKLIMEGWRQYLEEDELEQLDESFKALAAAAGIAFMTAFPASAQAGEADVIVTMPVAHEDSTSGPVNTMEYQDMFSQALAQALEGSGMKIYDNTNAGFFLSQQAEEQGEDPEKYMDKVEAAGATYGAAGIANAMDSNVVDIKFSYVKGKDNASSGTKATLTLVDSAGHIVDKEMGFIPNTGESWEIVQQMANDLVADLSLNK